MATMMAKKTTPPTAAEVRGRLILPLDDAPGVREAIARAAPLRERYEDLRQREFHYRQLTDPHLRLHVDRPVPREELLAAAEHAPSAAALAQAERAATDAERAVEGARQDERVQREQLFGLFMQSRCPAALAKVQAAVEALRDVNDIEHLRHETGSAGGFFDPIGLPQLGGWLELAMDAAKQRGYLD